MNETLTTLAATFENPRELIPLFAIVGGVLIAVVSIVCSAIGSSVRSAHAERSRREIAAYIAEGTMTSEEGERLLKAGASSKKSCC